MKHSTALDILIRAAGSQRKLAEAVGVSEEHVSRWRKGKYPIPDWVPAMAELIDQTHQREWPQRWRA